MGKNDIKNAFIALAVLFILVVVLKIFVPERGDFQSRTAFLDRSFLASKQKFLSGSGFFVSEEVIVTSAHVVEACNNIDVKSININGKAELLAIDDKNDLALLHFLGKKSGSYSTISTAKVKIGQYVAVTGYPEEDGGVGVFTIKDARVINDTYPLFDDNSIEITNAVKKGNSGAPLLNEEGQVIGVVVGRMLYYDDGITISQQQNIKERKPYLISGIAVSAKILSNFLQKHSVRQKALVHNANDHNNFVSSENYSVNVRCYLPDEKQIAVLD